MVELVKWPVRRALDRSRIVLPKKRFIIQFRERSDVSEISWFRLAANSIGWQVRKNQAPKNQVISSGREFSQVFWWCLPVSGKFFHFLIDIAMTLIAVLPYGASSNSEKLDGLVIASDRAEIDPTRGHIDRTQKIYCLFNKKIAFGVTCKAIHPCFSVR